MDIEIERARKIQELFALVRRLDDASTKGTGSRLNPEEVAMCYMALVVSTDSLIKFLDSSIAGGAQ